MLTTIKVVGIGSATDFPIPDAHDSTQVERGHEPGSHADLAEASVNNEFTIFGGRANPSRGSFDQVKPAGPSEI
jgi:hypothetical protein